MALLRSAYPQEWACSPAITGNAIQIAEPSSSSPTGWGVGVAYLTCQEEHQGKVWDFGIYAARDETAPFRDCELIHLIEVDGYGPHRRQRMHDLARHRKATVPAIRLPEERFKNLWEMAECALWASIWFCSCFEPRMKKLPCDFCDRLQWKAIF